MGVKVAEAFVEFTAKRARKFDETVNQVKAATAQATNATQASSAAAKTGAQAWDELTGGVWGASAATTAAGAALGTVVPVFDIATVAIKGLEIVAKLAGAALGSMKKAADELKAMKVLGDTAGYSASELSVMAWAMERAGGKLEDFISLRHGWNAAALDLQFGTGQAGTALRILGLRATDEAGKLRELRDMLPEISREMEKFNSKDRIKLSEALFGGGSDTFLKTLAKGNTSVKQMQLDARALGLQVNSTTVEAGTQVSDSWNTLLAELKTLWQNLVAAAQPLLVPLIAALISLLGMLNFMLSTFNSIIIRPVVSMFKMIYGVFQFVNRVVDKMHSNFGWMRKYIEFMFGSPENKGGDKSLGLGSLTALQGGTGFGATLGGLTEFARSMVQTAAGRSNVGEAQLAELRQHTQLLGEIAGGPVGTPTFGP